MYLWELIKEHGYRLSIFHEQCFHVVLLHDAKPNPSGIGFGSTMEAAIKDLQRQVLHYTESNLP